MPSAGGPVPSFASALVYIGLVDRDRAFELLRKAVENHDGNLSLKQEPMYDLLRADRRFADLIRQMGLP